MEACSGAGPGFLHNRLVHRVVRLLCVASVAGGLAGSAQSRPDAFVTFQMPSKNIGCGYLTGLGPATLRCDIRSGLRPTPRGTCELDWVGISMGRGAARPTCAGDTVFGPPAPVLAYGSVWKRGGFTCLASRIGISCENRAGHGFFLSREYWQAG
jgi:Family of unknown function (DUF6636)